MRRTLIVGGGYAGALCAMRLAKRSRERTSVILVNPRAHFVERIRLHEQAAGRRASSSSLVRRFAGTGVDVRIGHVSSIDLQSRRATIDSEAGSTSEAFDTLVVATGSRAHVPDLPGASASAFSVATEEDALRVRNHVSNGRKKSVVIVGGGFTGVELAAELAESKPGAHITIVSAPPLLPTLSAHARAYARRFLARRGVTIIEQRRASAVDARQLVLDSGDAVPADLTVWCTGFEASSFARDAGLAVSFDGRALVDERLRSTSHPFVYVVGDAAATRLRMACAVALPMGAFVADDIDRAAHDASPRPFSFAFAAVCLSLGRKDGIIQRTDALDTAHDSAWTGIGSAWTKELVCRYAMHTSTLERRGVRYRWPGQRALSSSLSYPLATKAR